MKRPTVALAFDVSFAELNEKILPNTALPLKFRVQERNICKFAGLARICQYPKMIPLHISTICTRPFGRIDDVALKRWARFTVE
jgi:hypothetical protein